jgi:hypothetical protein
VGSGYKKVGSLSKLSPGELVITPICPAIF